jgi:hypothetical protein
MRQVEPCLFVNGASRVGSHARGAAIALGGYRVRFEKIGLRDSPAPQQFEILLVPSVTR